MLGKAAIAESKLAAGNPLTILGVSMRVDNEGIHFTPDEEKVVKWTQQLNTSLSLGRLCPGDASKLGGRPTVCIAFLTLSLFACVCGRPPNVGVGIRL